MEAQKHNRISPINQTVSSAYQIIYVHQYIGYRCLYILHAVCSMGWNSKQIKCIVLQCIHVSDLPDPSVEVVFWWVLFTIRNLCYIVQNSCCYLKTEGLFTSCTWPRSSSPLFVHNCIIHTLQYTHLWVSLPCVRLDNVWQLYCLQVLNVRS